MNGAKTNNWKKEVIRIMTRLILFLVICFVIITTSMSFPGTNNNTPQDAFESYQNSLKFEDVNLLLEVYHLPDAARMSQSRLMRELKYLKGYDGYRNYSIYQITEDNDVAKVKVKGTLGNRENVRRTFLLKRFTTGWKITNVWNY